MGVDVVQLGRFALALPLAATDAANQLAVDGGVDDDVADVDALFLILAGDDLRQRPEAKLAGREAAEAGIAAQRAGGAREDDGASSGGQHVRQHALGGPEGAEEVDARKVLKLLRRGVEHRAAVDPSRPGVVHQHLDGAEFGADALEARRHRVLDAQVGDVVPCRARAVVGVDALRHRLEFVLGAREQGDDEAFRREAPGDCFANPGAGAHHDDDGLVGCVVRHGGS